MIRFFAPLLIALLVASAAVAQDPAEPVEPPTEETGDPESQDEPTEPEVPLTPEQLERQRKLDEEAAVRAAKREARRIKRAGKKEAEAAKRAEKEDRQGVKLADQIAMTLQEGYDLLDEGVFQAARQRFRKANELEGGSSWAGQMGLAETELASENFSIAVREALDAARSTTEFPLKAEAFAFAGTATLAARPATESAQRAAKSGIDMYEAAALRFFMRAATTAPDEAIDAMAHVEQRFPSRETSVQFERLMTRYLTTEDEVEEEAGEVGGAESDEEEDARPTETFLAHRRRALLSYEAQLTRSVPGDKAVAVVGTIVPPQRTGGSSIEFTPAAGEKSRRRLLVSFEVDTRGGVSAVTVLNSVNESLDRAAAKALRKWTFEPARLPDGQPIAVFWLAAANVQPAPEPPAEESPEGSPGPGR